MAVLKIFNDIQSENEKKACQFWGDAEGVCFKDVDEFVAGMDADDNVMRYGCIVMVVMSSRDGAFMTNCAQLGKRLPQSLRAMRHLWQRSS